MNLASENNLSRNSLYAIIIPFLLGMSGVLMIIYYTTLFLSVYPPSWLVYLFLGKAFFTILFSLVLSPALMHNIKKNALIIMGGCCLILVVFLGLRQLNYFWIPLIIAIVTGSIGSISEVTALNTLPLAFGFRDYKKIARYFGQTSSAGVIVGSFFVPLLLKFYSLESLLIVSIICLMVCGLLIYSLVFLEESENKSTVHSKVSTMQYPLFRKLLWFTILVAITQTIIDYTFKFELAHYYTGKALAEFQGYYAGITNVLALIVGLTTTRFILKYLRIDGLLYITQILTLLSCLLVVFYPSLWSYTILASMRGIFYFNYAAFAIEIILNILPSAIRAASKFQIKTNVRPIFTTSSYFLLLFAAAQHISSKEIIIFTGILILPIFYFIKQLVNEYKITLQQEAEFRRFNIVDELTPANAAFFSNIANNALQSDDANIVLLGLSLRDKIEDSEKLSTAVYQHLNNPNILVRKAVVDHIKNIKDKHASKPLLQRFFLEDNPELKFWLLDTLSLVDSASALKIAKDHIHQPTSDVYPAAIHILLQYGDASEKNIAIPALHNLVKNPDPLLKKKAAYIIGKFGVNEFENDLNLLIADSDNLVSETAIQVSAESNILNLVPQILKRLSPGLITYTAKGAVVRLGVPTIPYILAEIPNSKDPSLLIQLLAAIPGPEAEKALLSLASEKKVFQRTLVAKDVNFRACRHSVGTEFKQAAMQMVLEEVGCINELKTLLQRYPQEAISVEIKSRIQMAKQRCLYWLAIGSNPVQINKLIPILLKPEEKHFLKSREKAIELLEVYIKDRELAQQVIGIFEEQPKNKIKNITAVKFKDEWLDHVISSQTNPTKGENMDLLLKVFNLRQIDLFKNLAGEVLLAIAEETQQVSFNEGETIFREGDAPDGLYCITSGKVKIIRQGKELNILQTHDYFGELGLIDGATRTASAIAETDCVLLMLEKNTFERITNDLPDVLWCVTRAILRYLRQNLNSQITTQ